MTFNPSIFDHILMVLLAVVLPYYAVVRSQPKIHEIHFDTRTKIAMYYGNSLALWLPTLVILVVWFLQGRNMIDLGFHWPVADFSTLSWGLTALFVLLYSADVLSEIYTPEKRAKTQEHWIKHTPFLPANFREFSHFNILAITAGITEEIIFRAYFMQYLWSVLGNSLVAQVVSVLLPALVFAAVHIYQGKKAVLKIVVMAILFGWIYLLTQSLWLLIGLHILVDVIGGALAVWIMPETINDKKEMTR